MADDPKDKDASEDETQEPAGEGGGGDKAGGGSSAALTFGEGAGTSLAAVTAGDAVEAAARKVAAAVTAAGNIVIVEDREIALSDVVRLQVATRLEGFASMLSTTEAVVAEALARLPGAPSVGGPPQGAQLDALGGETPTDLGPLAAIGQIAEVVGALRSTFDIASVPVSVSRSTLTLAVAGALLAKDPPPASVRIPSAGALVSSTIFTSAKDCTRRRYALEEGVVRLEAAAAAVDADIAARRARIVELDGQRDAAVKKGQDGASDAARLATLIATERQEIATAAAGPAYRDAVAATKAARAVMTAVDAGLTDLSKAPDATHQPLLVRAALREYLEEAAKTGVLLWVDVAASGGDRVSKESPLGWNSSAAFLGGVHVAFIVTRLDGTIEAAGTRVALASQTFDFNHLFGSPLDGFWSTWTSLKLGIAELLAIGFLLFTVLLVAGLVLHFVFGLF